MHIAIAGNIGSGKTTLTTMLAKRYGWEPRYESVEYNPYLDDYYKDIKRWSFAMEVFFLKERFKDLLEISQSEIMLFKTAPSTKVFMCLRLTTTQWAILMNAITKRIWSCSKI